MINEYILSVGSQRPVVRPIHIGGRSKDGFGFVTVVYKGIDIIKAFHEYDLKEIVSDTFPAYYGGAGMEFFDKPIIYLTPKHLIVYQTFGRDI